MYGRRIGLGFVVAAVGGVMIAGPVRADTPLPVPVPLVVDLDGIFDHSKVGQAVAAEFTAHNKNFEKAHAKQEAQLEQMQQQLEQEHATMAPELFNQKYNDFQQEAQQWRQDEQLNERAVGLAEEDAREKILRALHEIIGAVALEKHANLVLLESQVFIRADAYDISEEVLTRLDQQMPTLKVVIPKVTAQSVAGAPGSGQGAPNQ